MLIKRAKIDVLVIRYCTLTEEGDKNEAVQAQIKALASQERVTDRAAKIQRSAAEAGFVVTGGKLKPFFDDQRGDG